MKKSQYQNEVYESKFITQEAPNDDILTEGKRGTGGIAL